MQNLSRRSAFRLALLVAAFPLVTSLPAVADGTTGTPVEATPTSITLALGTGSTVMIERPFKTVLIGNPDIIDVQTQTERSVLLKPLSPGATNLVFIDEQGIVITNLSVMVRNAGAI